jgi:hypothetical protein
MLIFCIYKDEKSIIERTIQYAKDRTKNSMVTFSLQQERTL